MHLRIRRFKSVYLFQTSRNTHSSIFYLNKCNKFEILWKYIETMCKSNIFLSFVIRISAIIEFLDRQILFSIHAVFIYLFICFWFYIKAYYKRNIMHFPITARIEICRCNKKGVTVTFTYKYSRFYFRSILKSRSRFYGAIV